MKRHLLLSTLFCLLFGYTTTYAQLPLAKVNEFQTQATQYAENKEYGKALSLYQRAFTEYAAIKEYQSSIDCGMKAVELCVQQSSYKEAFDLLREINQVIRKQASLSGKPQNINYFALAKERFLLNLKLRNQAQASAQLERMEEIAKNMNDVKINNELLYLQTAFDYSFGKNEAGDASLQKLINIYSSEKQFDEIVNCYQSLINLSKQVNSANLTAHMYVNFMMWSDSINAAKSREEFETLQQKHNDSLDESEHLGKRLSYRMYIIMAIGIVLVVVALLLILLFINQIRLKASNRSYKKKIQTANEFSELKTQFIHNISSQIEPSLNVFNHIANSLPDTLKNEKSSLIEQSSAIGSFTNHISEVTTLETSLNTPFAVDAINVKAFCDELAETITPKLQPNVTLSVDAPKIQIKANKEQLTHLLTHLLENATEYTQEGTIRLEFKKRGAHTHQFIVSDNGPGIAPEKQADLFKPFKQVEDLTKGDGLGLPICSLIATKMNGSLTLDKTYKKGAKFILEIQS